MLRGRRFMLFLNGFSGRFVRWAAGCQPMYVASEAGIQVKQCTIHCKKEDYGGNKRFHGG
ncbi:MAG: hypothetical protein IKZ84_03785 [Victivallales bacterium]|nr:hypothetical protein [Victivallales bacterium]MBR5837641.1 hypothetical protein [Victivallales bacterium]